MVERVETGIPGLDELLEGGFVKGSSNLLCGTTGTGKTIFGCQYIWHGLQIDEPGVYITLEQLPEEIKADVAEFGWNFDEYIQKKKCIMDYLPPQSLDEMKFNIFSKVSEIKAKRLVIDNISLMSLGFEGKTKLELRHQMFNFLKDIKKENVTALLITEIPEESKGLSRFGIEEFVADGIIVLHYLEFSSGGTPRSLVIRKMRRTKHGTDVYPFEITDKGIVVKKI